MSRLERERELITPWTPLGSQRGPFLGSETRIFRTTSDSLREFNQESRGAVGETQIHEIGNSVELIMYLVG
jgi:hypothetical protein